MSEINVTVVNFNRRYWYMRYVDPLTGKVVAKSSGTEIKKEALKIAAKWEAELQEGRYKSPSKVSWAEFRHRYEDEVLASLAPATALKVSGVFNSIEALIGIDKLAKLDASQISRFQRRLREEKKLSESTIKGSLAHLKAALNWAKRVGLLTEAPAIEMPKRAKGGKIMKGRPITLEEFERLLEKVPEVVGKTDPESEATKSTVRRWKWFLRGLWFSGLRIGEALELYWDRSDKLTVELSGKFPMLMIPAELEKGNKDRMMPLAPEFAEMLLSVPQDERQGPIFKLGIRDPDSSPKRIRLSHLVSAIGEKAGVKVNTDGKTGKVKYASAHDLRRSFGERWSQRVMPQLLQEMMRHESIETTLKFYVGRNANTAAATMWDAFNKSTAEREARDATNSEASDTSSNTSPESHTDAGHEA